MNCSEYRHEDPFGGSKSISGTTCQGIVGSFYLMYGESICMDNERPIEVCDALKIYDTCFVTATPTPSNTATPTQTSTPTNTATPTSTSNPVCPQELFALNTNSLYSGSTGTYTRQTTFTGGTMIGGYLIAPNEFVSGPHPIDGNFYSVFAFNVSGTTWYNFLVTNINVSRFVVIITTGAPINLGGTRIFTPFGSATLTLQLVNIGGIIFPAPGDGVNDYVITYPISCPTPTPTTTPTQTSTPTLTKTPTNTRTQTPTPTTPLFLYRFYVMGCSCPPENLYNDPLAVNFPLVDGVYYKWQNQSLIFRISSVWTGPYSAIYDMRFNYDYTTGSTCSSLLCVTPTPTITNTPTITPTPSVTIGLTPSNTPTNTRTPSSTPPTPNNFYFVQEYTCSTCVTTGSTIIAGTQGAFALNNYYAFSSAPNRKFLFLSATTGPSFNVNCYGSISSSSNCASVSCY
jgi:hypothetical protein